MNFRRFASLLSQLIIYHLHTLMTAKGNAKAEKSKDKAKLISTEDEGSQAAIAILNEVQHRTFQDHWIPLAQSTAGYSIYAWSKAIEHLIYNPEQSSSTILRADILSDEGKDDSSIGHLKCQRRIVRNILPRRPNLDKNLEQVCVIYMDDESKEGIATLTPILNNKSAEEIPYYHPKVQSLAFHFCKNDDETTITRLYIIPFAEEQTFNAITSPQSRLSRTALALLDLQSRLAFGVENGYKKRVEHDLIVDRKEYQELYMQLRERHASFLMQTWCESTDPGKHVFEDLGIVTFIILLWRTMFPQTNGKPPAYVDVGCGNGLLVYLLSKEGFSGYGVDVQARKSWDHYRNCSSEVDLRAESIDPPAMCSGTTTRDSFPEGSFLIGNHADELTSWLPLMAHCTPNCSGLINIPCCRFDLDGTISSRSKYPIDEKEIETIVGKQNHTKTMQEIQRGPFAEADTTSRNIAYLRYVSHLHLHAGWQLEKEALRIPSTKNWAFVGRKRIWQNGEDTLGKDYVDGNVQSIAQKYGSQWHARVSPTKAQGNH